MRASTGLPVVGVLGGGPLARMTHQAAIALGQSLRVLAASPDDAAAAAGDVVIGEHGSYPDLETFAKACDVVTTYDEHVPAEHLRRLAAAGRTVLPGADAVSLARDRQSVRARLGELGLPVAAGGEVPRRRQLSALVARSPYGQGAAWPVAEIVHRDGTCVEVVAPAPDLPARLAEVAEQLALTVARELDVVGVLAVQLVERTGGELMVTELAMHPHSSGHWTVEGSRTSQFEQHLRAVLDYPLGSTDLTAPAVATASIHAGEPGPVGPDERLHHLFAADPGAKVHLYGEPMRPGRIVGHVTVLGRSPRSVRERAGRAARLMCSGPP